MPISGAYTDEAKRLRAEIKKKFKTQVALCQAIGAKDTSYITAYVTGKNRIGNILREKLEAVGIDVNYILYGKKGSPQLPPPPPDPTNNSSNSTNSSTPSKKESLHNHESNSCCSSFSRFSV